MAKYRTAIVLRPIQYFYAELSIFSITLDVSYASGHHRHNNIRQARDHIFGIFVGKHSLAVRVRMVKTDDFEFSTLNFTLYAI